MGWYWRWYTEKVFSASDEVISLIMGRDSLEVCRVINLKCRRVSGQDQFEVNRSRAAMHCVVVYIRQYAYMLARVPPMVGDVAAYHGCDWTVLLFRLAVVMGIVSTRVQIHNPHDLVHALEQFCRKIGSVIREHSHRDFVFYHPVFWKGHRDQILIYASLGYYFGQFLETVDDDQEVLDTHRGSSQGTEEVQGEEFEWARCMEQYHWIRFNFEPESFLAHF